MMAKSHKVLIYVEGESEEILFNQYLKKYIKDNHSINIECQKGDIPSFKRKIKQGLYLDYKEIFILRDIKTQMQHNLDYPCITKMKEDFTTLKTTKFIGNIGRSYEFIVVCNEIESWILTFKKNTNNRSEKHIQEIYTELNCNKKVPCMKKYVTRLKRDELVFDITNNKSFKYFMDKLILCK
jgi:hypothetical protein